MKKEVLNISYIIYMIFSISIFSVFQSKVSILPLLGGIVLGICLAIFLYNELDIERTIIIIFLLAIPFFTDINIMNNANDFHVGAKPYYRFNYEHIFIMIFLVLIIKNIEKIKIKKDLIILGSLVIISFVSMIWAKNPAATFFDAIRYFSVFIIYVYFSRIFNYKNNINLVINSLILGGAFQLLLGLLQIIKGGYVGLGILGESHQVFRVGVSGYERGMSGTFGHPGPIALYSLIIFSWILFNRKINKIIKYIGMGIFSTIIILAAGRTCIILWVLVLMIFAFRFCKDNYKIITNLRGDRKKIYIFISSMLMLLMIFRNQIIAIVNRFVESDFLGQLNARGRHIELAIEYIKQKPILGLGLNNYLDYTIIDYADIFGRDFFVSNPIHNAYLLFFVELGIIGGILYILIFIDNLLYRKRMKLKFTGREIDKTYKGYIVAIVVCAIYNLQGWGALQDKCLILFFISSALLYNIYNEKQLDNDQY